MNSEEYPQGNPSFKSGDHGAAGVIDPLRPDQRGPSSRTQPIIAQIIAQPEPIVTTAPAPAQDEAQRKLEEAEHWETLRALLTQLPPAASPGAVGSTWETVAKDAAKIPLLKSAAPQESAIIKRSTAAHFPLPSVVPSTQTEAHLTAQADAQKSGIKTHVAMQPGTTPGIEAVLEAPTAAATIAETTEVKPEQEKHAPSHRSESRKHAVLHEKLRDNWVESISQRVLSTLGHSRPSRTSASGSRPVQNQAEVSYNPQGKVEYVTYTFNAPARRNNGHNR